MSTLNTDTTTFAARFVNRAQAERYRDRYKTGRHRKVDQRERAALRELLGHVGRLSSVMDLPSGVGRLTPVLAEVADRVILADSSPIMLELAREEMKDRLAEYRELDAESIAMPDGSVDLIFSHRFIHHIHNAESRMRIIREIARVTRRYVIFSYYPPGIRSMLRRGARRLMGKNDKDRPATLAGFVAEVATAGLRLVHRQTLRRIPPGAFFLFERVDPIGTTAGRSASTARMA